MAADSRLTGIIFSDMGQASVFMALDWVQDLLMQRLGYHPFPATLNVRPQGAQDVATWRRVQSDTPGTPLTAATESHCGATLYRVDIWGKADSEKVGGAVLVPEVDHYPKDKIEIIAPVRLKDHFGVGDGDPLILEFVN
jgi:CTP-dependent riboflavin kinase